MNTRDLLKELGIEVDPVEVVEEAGRWVCNTTFWREVYPPLDPANCKGVRVKDVHGKEYIDMVGGVAARPFGYNFDEYLALAKKALELPFALVSQDFDHVFQTLLAKELAHTHPHPEKVEVGFGTSGGRANEFAIKSIIDRTGKTKFICFSPSFHGRTGYTLPLTNSKSVQRARYPLALEVYRFDYVNEYYLPKGISTPSQWAEVVLYQMEKTLSRAGDDVGGMIMEPLCGEGGYVPPYPPFVKMVWEFAKDRGIAFISDEVQAGLGRTGKFWGFQHYGIDPDYITVAKGLAGGLPLSATVGPKPMFTAGGRHSETFGAEPFTSFLALYTVRKAKGLVEEVAKKGEKFLEGLKDIAKRTDGIKNPRGLGLMLGFDVEDREKFIRKGLEHGLLLLGTGEKGIRLIPPLTITEEEIDESLERLEKTARSL